MNHFLSRTTWMKYDRALWRVKFLAPVFRDRSSPCTGLPIPTVNKIWAKNYLIMFFDSANWKSVKKIYWRIPKSCTIRLIRVHYYARSIKLILTRFLGLLKNVSLKNFFLKIQLLFYENQESSISHTVETVNRFSSIWFQGNIWVWFFFSLTELSGDVWSHHCTFSLICTRITKT